MQIAQILTAMVLTLPITVLACYAISLFALDAAERKFGVEVKDAIGYKGLVAATVLQLGLVEWALYYALPIIAVYA